MQNDMTARKPIYEGKAKTIFAGPDDDHLIQYFKDDATAFNAARHDIIAGKGVLNNLISEHIMLHLADAGINTHFVRRLNSREQLVRRVSIVPVEVVVRNIAAGSLVKRLGGEHIRLEDGQPLAEVLVEYYLKEDALNDPIISEAHITLFGIADIAELEEIRTTSLKINTLLQQLFAGINVTLVDFKLEYGRLADGSLILADEISPDNCRLWDSSSGRKMDKDRFRQGLGGLAEAYGEIASRLGIAIDTAARPAAGQDKPGS